MKSISKAGQNAQQSALILMLSTIVVKIISACFKIPLSTKFFLGDLGYGYFSVAYDLFTPFYTLAISGLPSALSHIIAEKVAQNNFSDINKTFYVTKRLFFIFGLIFSVLISLFAIPFVRLTDTTGNTLYSVYAIIPSIFLCFIISVYRGYFEGFRNMNPTAVSKIIEALGKLLLGLGFSFLVIKLTNNPALAAGGGMLGITVGTFIATVYLHFCYKKNHKILNVENFHKAASGDTKKTVKLILLLAIPMAFSSLVSGAVTLIDAITVRPLLSKEILNLFNSYETVINEYNSYSASAIGINELTTYLYGLRSKAFTFFNLIPTLTMSLGVGALPMISECFAKRDILGVKNNLKTIIKLISLITLPSGMAYIAVSEPIMELIYSDYGSVNIGGKLLCIYGFTAIFAGFSIPLTSILQSLKLQLNAMWNIIIGALIKIILNILLVSNLNLNIYGSAISTAVCYLYILIAHTICLIKALGKVGDFKNILLKPFIASVFSTLCALILCNISSSKILIICGIAASVIIYIVVVFALKTFTKEEIYNLPKGDKFFDLAKKIKIFK